jgi:hypothetical protein
MASLKMPNKKDNRFPKYYLGDGVYAAFDGYQIILAANGYDNPTDTIALQDDVMQALKRFEQRIKEENK